MTKILNPEFYYPRELKFDVINPDTQEILFKAGHTLSWLSLITLLKLGIEEIEII